MAKSHGKNSRVYLDALNISGVSNSWEVSNTDAVADVTCYSDDFVHRVAGVQDWSGVVSGFFDPDTETVGAELVTNADMELDSDWVSQVSPSTNERSSSQAHSGTYSRHLVTDADGEGVKNDALYTTDAATQYRVSVWVYINSVTATDVLATFRSGDGTTYTTIGTTSTSDSWVEISGSVVDVSGGSAGLILVRQNGAGTADYYIDNVSIKPLWTYDGYLNNLSSGSTIFGAFPTGPKDSGTGYEGVVNSVEYALSGPIDGPVAYNMSLSGSGKLSRTTVLSSCANLTDTAACAGTITQVLSASKAAGTVIGFLRATSASMYGGESTACFQGGTGDAASDMETYIALEDFSSACAQRGSYTGSVGQWMRYSWSTVSASSPNIDFIASVEAYS